MVAADFMGFPGGSVVKNMPANARDAGSIPGSGRSPGEGQGNPLQYSCPENPMDRGAWWATVHGVSKSQTGLKQLSMHTCKDSVEREWASLIPRMVKNLPAM